MYTDLDTVLTAEEARILLGHKDSSRVRRYCEHGRIPGVVLKGKTWLIPREGWEEFLKKPRLRGGNRRPPRPEKPILPRELAVATEMIETESGEMIPRWA